MYCTACGQYLEQPILCSAYAALAVHWMSDHTAAWLELHPEHAWFLEELLPT